MSIQTPLPTAVTPTSWATWLKRPEVYAFIVAVIVSGLVWLAHLIRLPITDPQLNATAVSFWLAFVGFVFEGRYRGATYAKDFSDFLKSLKFQAPFVGLLVVVLSAGLTWLGITLPADLISNLSLCIYAIIVGKTTIDSIGVATNPPPLNVLSEVAADVLMAADVATSHPEQPPAVK